MDELKDALRSPQALELILAQVAKRGPVREPVHDQRRRGRRQKDLATVTGRHDPRGAVERWPEVVALARGGLPNVKPHPHPKRPGLTPRLVPEAVLGFEAGAYAVRRGAEDGHQSVPGRLHHLPVRALHRVAEDRVVALERLRHGLPRLLPQLGAALEVCEQKGEGLRRQLSTHQRRSSP